MNLQKKKVNVITFIRQSIQTVSTIDTYKKEVDEIVNRNYL